MAMIPQEMKPAIFNDIIRQRLNDYMKKEFREVINDKIDSIVRDVMGDIQTDVNLYRDMMHYEAKLIVTAVYNGVNVEQKSKDQHK